MRWAHHLRVSVKTAWSQKTKFPRMKTFNISQVLEVSNAERIGEWRKKNPGKQRAISQRNYIKNGRRPDQIKARRKYHLKKTYGITLEQYERMLVEQNGVCAVCKQPETT